MNRINTQFSFDTKTKRVNGRRRWKVLSDGVDPVLETREVAVVVFFFRVGRNFAEVHLGMNQTFVNCLNGGANQGSVS